MEIRKISTLLIVTILCLSCKNTNKTPNEFTLSTINDSGFSFKKMKIVDHAFTRDTYTDFVLVPGTSLTGDLSYPTLKQIDNQSLFILSKQFDNLASAKKYFDQYKLMEENASDFERTAYMIQPYQVWIICTNSFYTGKILIISTNTTMSNGIYNSEIKIKAQLLK
jgi:hypothetical protein